MDQMTRVQLGQSLSASHWVSCELDENYLMESIHTTTFYPPLPSRPIFIACSFSEPPPYLKGPISHHNLGTQRNPYIAVTSRSPPEQWRHTMGGCFPEFFLTLSPPARNSSSYKTIVVRACT